MVKDVNSLLFLTYSNGLEMSILAYSHFKCYRTRSEKPIGEERRKKEKKKTDPVQ